MDWVKKVFPGITDEQLKAFKQELPNHFIPKEQYNKKADELKAKEQDTEAAKEQLTANEKLLKELQDKAALTDEYKTKLEKQQADYETFKTDSEKRLENVTKTTALEKALRKAKASDDAIDLLIKDFDLDALMVKDGEIADDVLKPVMEKRPNLFVKEILDGDKPKDGKKSEEQGNTAEMRRLMGLPPK